jgi:uncharacterized protein (TIGR00251 family)
LLACKVQTRAKATAFGELRNGEVIVKLHAPPIDGRANSALCQFVASAFGVPRNRIAIVRGEHNRHKVLRIADVVDVPDALRWLAPHAID